MMNGKRTQISAFFFSAALALSSVAISACGNISALPNSVTVSKGSYEGLSSVDSATQDPYTCPDSANVLPDYQYTADNADRFTVCPKKGSSTDVAIHGKLAHSDTLCFFPAQYIDERHIYVKPALDRPGPLYQCITVTDAGAFASFQGVNYNAAFIVESPYRDAMAACLVGGNYYSCPPYSFGRFR